VDVFNLGFLVDCGTIHAGAFGVGVCGAGGVEMALNGVPEAADELFVVQNWELGFGVLGRDNFQFHAHVAATGLGHVEAFHALFGLGQLDAAGQMEADVLA